MSSSLTKQNKLFFSLAGPHYDLAAAEIAQVFPGRLHIDHPFVILAPMKAVIFSRLALSHWGSELLFSCKDQELQAVVKRAPWEKIVKGSFAVQTQGITDKAALEQLIGACITHPVSLRQPDTVLMFCKGKQIHCAKLLWKNTEKFQDRRAHLRPGSSPISLHPRLARALVNLTGVPDDGVIIDPMCGTGGFLIEAGLMGIRSRGYDIDEKILAKCKANLDHFKIEKSSIQHQDALSLNDPISYLVTDLPYGRNTNPKGIADLYEKFFSLLGRLLRKRAVVVVPSTTKIIFSRHGLVEKNSFLIRVHKSLTRKILVIEPGP
ncbi:hypothetical protein J4460_08015 [Candidatus Woesearchaeota archaeon]|nr:hypothetical protein [Candidatus Woesearchaeota archaeon]HIH38313.1 hypothetical protein [Candidatus Woesearchaeota archaeon]HIH48451.1 hypothetical protein [Candidatus Woesearchaeota archaeon]HIJ03295.1 hypothetical protein [Candidatus Woesearchaeota archaeon]